MIRCENFVCGELYENCYVVYDTVSLDSVIIDPGNDSDFEKIYKYILENKLKLKMVLLTHGHFDHIGACKNFQDKGIPIAINKFDEPKCLSNKLSLMEEYGNGLALNTFKPDYLFNFDEEEITLGTLKIKVVYTPGHSDGSSSFIIGNFIFSGDTIFENGYGRTDFYDGSSQKLRQSIIKLLPYLNSNYILKPGH